MVQTADVDLSKVFECVLCSKGECNGYYKKCEQPKKCQCKCQHSDVENLRKIFGEVTKSVRNAFTQLKSVATDGVVAATIVAMGAVTGTVVTAIEAGWEANSRHASGLPAFPDLKSTGLKVFQGAKVGAATGAAAAAHIVGNLNEKVADIGQSLKVTADAFTLAVAARQNFENDSNEPVNGQSNICGEQPTSDDKEVGYKNKWNHCLIVRFLLVYYVVKYTHCWR